MDVRLVFFYVSAFIIIQEQGASTKTQQQSVGVGQVGAPPGIKALGDI